MCFRASERRFLQILGASVLLTVVCGLGSYVTAEIPPQEYDRLKREAPEVLQVTITKVTKTAKSTEDVLVFDVEATVNSIDRSQAGYTPESRVTFESYYVTPEARRNGFVGPASPPILKTGWTGRIYLGDNPDFAGLAPAAYGKSFEESAGARANVNRRRRR